MSGQAGFDGFAPAVASDRLFLAILPDAAGARRIAALAEGLRAEFGLRARALPAERLHLTLHYFGEFAGVPAALVAAVDGVMRGLAAPGFEVVFDRVASFGGGAGRKPWVLLGGTEANGPLQALQQRSGRRLAEAGLALPGQGRFRPHVTLLYDGALPQRTIDPVVLAVHEVALVDSLVGRGQHRVLRRWPLAEAGLAG